MGIRLLGLLSVLIFLMAAPAEARILHTGLIFSIQPIVGWEKSVKYYPEIHYHDRLIYGARIIAGLRKLAAEAEVTRGTDTENFYRVPRLLDPTVKIEDTTERAKLGLRTTYDLPVLLSVHFRAGGEASRNTHKFTNAGVTTTSVSKIKYAPYFGGGLSIWIGVLTSLTADGVVIVNDVHDWRRTEYQGTASLAFNFL